MAKLSTYIKATYDVLPGYATLAFPYNTLMIGALKKYPGCRWNDARHAWLVPNELAPGFLDFAQEKLGWEPMEIAGPSSNLNLALRSELYPYQREDIIKALSIKRAMLAWEMGLGKTLGGIEWLRLSGNRRNLIVCPAMARGVWEEQLGRWWPTCPKVVVIRDGKAAADCCLEHGSDDEWTCIISFELLKKLRLPAGRLQSVLGDESHYIKEERVQRSKAFKETIEQHRVEWRLLLTGTPITVNPIDIFNQVDCLYPGRLGRNKYDFGDTYCGRVENSYRHRGYDYDGVNPIRSEELFKRLEAFVFRRTKGEVADQLPELITQTIRLRPDRSIQKRLDEALRNGGDIAALLEAAGNQKVDPLIDMIEEDFEGGATHVNVTTYHHVVADEFAGRLEDSIGKWSIKPIVFHLGKAPEKRRNAIIAEAKKTPHSILVTTMKAINVGINLTKFSPTYCAELYGAPGIMNQWAGRFHRVGGENEKPVIRFVVLEGTEEEATAQVLEKRMKEHGKVVPSGHVDKMVLAALEKQEESPAEFLRRVREAVNAGDEEDVYGGAI